MFPLLVISGVIGFTLAYAPLHEPGPMYNDASFIQDVMSRINRDMDGEGGFLDFGNKMDDMSGVSGAYLPGRTPKDSEIFENVDYDSLMGVNPHPAMRDQEFLQHSSLYGHKFMTGGTSENSKNSLKYKGVQPVPADVKTDATLPAYCNPPNPCPVGYTADDGCLEIFENTAPFSRAYQASQDCMCDTEHMFDCPASRDSEESDMDSSNQRDFLNELQIPSAVGTIVSSMKVSIIPALSIHMEGQHKSLVAKKFYTQKSHDQKLSRLNEMAREAAAAAAHDNNGEENVNPYLQGEKLPIAAKKGHHALHF